MLDTTHELWKLGALDVTQTEVFARWRDEVTAQRRFIKRQLDATMAAMRLEFKSEPTILRRILGRIELRPMVQPLTQLTRERLDLCIAVNDKLLVAEEMRDTVRKLRPASRR